jgi:Tfp pilus assembly protein PilX
MKQVSIRSQRGAVALVVAVVLLVGITLIVFFANRSIIFEQRTSANQYRSTKAMQAAEAGMEWALANLNTALNLDTACAATTAIGSRNFRDTYLNPVAATNPPVYTTTTAAYSSARPACTRQGAGGWNCACPAGTSATTGAPTCDGSATGACAKFEIRFERVQDPALGTACSGGTPSNCVISAVKVTSTGYTDTGNSPDGTATVSQIFKMISGLASPPGAALTAKLNVDLSGNLTVTNTDPSSNGITINSGGPATLDGSSSVVTIPGTPPGASIASNDTSLSALTDDQMFETFFGMSKTAFQNLPTTYQITCPMNCDPTVANAIAAGADTIWINGNLNLNNAGPYGEPTRPVIIIATGNIHVNGNTVVNGLMYSQAAVWDNSGGGTGHICGAAIAEGSFTGQGTPDPTYCPDVLSLLKKTTGPFAKVPGSWRDF